MRRQLGSYTGRKAKSLEDVARYMLRTPVTLSCMRWAAGNSELLHLPSGSHDHPDDSSTASRYPKDLGPSQKAQRPRLQHNRSLYPFELVVARAPFITLRVSKINMGSPVLPLIDRLERTPIPWYPSYKGKITADGDIVQELRERIRGALRAEADEGVVSVYLFGSQASSRAHRESDIDLGVLLSWEICRTSKDRFEVRVGMSSRLTNALGGPVDVVILNDAPPQLARRIVTAGERLLCFDTELDHSFVRDTLIRAADIEPFLRRTRRIKLDAIMR